MSVNKLNIKTSELFTVELDYLKDFFAKSEYPWELLPEIKNLKDPNIQFDL